MKQLPKSIQILLFIFYSAFCSAQDSGLHWAKIDTSLNNLFGKLRGEDQLITIESSIYHFIYDDFYPGTVTLTDHAVIDDVKLRYSAYNDELISFNPNVLAQFCKLDKNTVKEFTIEESSGNGEKRQHKFVKLYYQSPIVNTERYFEELYSGNTVLLAFHRIIKEHVHSYRDKLGLELDVKYRLRTKYYLYYGEDKFVEIKSRKRLFLKRFEDNKPEVRRLLRQNNINLRKEGSLKEAVKLLDKAGLLNE